VHLHPAGAGLLTISSLLRGSVTPGTVSETHPGTAKYPESLCLRPVLPTRRETSRVSSKGVTPSSSLLRTHAPILNPPAAYGQSLGRQVCAGCHQPLLGLAPSQRYLHESFPRCLDPYPGAPRGALTRFFPQGIGLPHFLTGSARHKIPDNDFSPGIEFRGCSHSLMFRPPGLLATQIVPTTA